MTFSASNRSPTADDLADLPALFRGLGHESRSRTTKRDARFESLNGCRSSSPCDDAALPPALRTARPCAK